MAEDATASPLPLRDLHLAWGARLVPFAGWEMPLQYGDGIMAEHLATRADATLFDVSHMGQVVLTPRRGVDAVAAEVEALTPADVAGLAPGRQRYALLTTDGGGILDDAMIAHHGERLVIVVNAGNRAPDLAHLTAGLPGAEVAMADRALLAVQGPRAAERLAPLLPGAAALRFMDVATLPWQGHALWVSRSGYTGEDGFEISLPLAAAEPFARAVVAAGVTPAGLGARDSLRLEAGLPLHGSDIDAATSPVEAALGWSIGRARRAGGAREGGFPGAARILAELRDGPARLRVGLRPEGRQPVRGGADLVHEGATVGTVTSGGFGPSVGAPVAMGFVPAALTAPGTRLDAVARGRALSVVVAPLPFVPPGFQR